MIVHCFLPLAFCLCFYSDAAHTQVGVSLQDAADLLEKTPSAFEMQLEPLILTLFPLYSRILAAHEEDSIWNSVSRIVTVTVNEIFCSLEDIPISLPLTPLFLARLSQIEDRVTPEIIRAFRIIVVHSSVDQKRSLVDSGCWQIFIQLLNHSDVAVVKDSIFAMRALAAERDGVDYERFIESHYFDVLMPGLEQASQQFEQSPGLKFETEIAVPALSDSPQPSREFAAFGWTWYRSCSSRSF
jgi:hypothetical protein